MLLSHMYCVCVWGGIYRREQQCHFPHVKYGHQGQWEYFITSIFNVKPYINAINIMHSPKYLNIEIFYTIDLVSYSLPTGMSHRVTQRLTL